MSSESHISCTTWSEAEMLQERASAIDRSGKRLSRILALMRSLEEELDRLELTLFIPGLTDEMREEALAEMELSTDAYNHLREAPADAYRQLVRQRESCGFRGHDLIQRCFPIPDLRLPPEVVELME